MKRANLNIRIFALMLLLINACGEYQYRFRENNVYVVTLEATEINSNSATIEYEISNSVNFHFVLYSTKPGISLDTDSKKASNGQRYSGQCYRTYLTSLEASTTYYYRAYIEDGYGAILYGEEKSFTTKEYSLPSVTTSYATSIGATTVSIGGIIEFIGDPSYTERGVCYSTSQNPTTNNNKLQVAGSGEGSFRATASGLSPNTTYYVKAYATNVAGTAYGNQESFKTTTLSYARVRFKKEKAYDYVSKMDVSDDNLSAIAGYTFGTSSGTSPYYTIPAGNHIPIYYYTYPGNEGRYYCLSSPHTYNFVAGRQYTVVCSDDGSYLTFYVTNDGLYSAPPNENPPNLDVFEIPKSQIGNLNFENKATIK